LPSTELWQIDILKGLLSYLYNTQ